MSTTLLTILGCTSMLLTVATIIFAAGGERQRARQVAADLVTYKGEVSKKFDEAGHETSKAWSYVQGIESRVIKECANRELMDTRFMEHRRELDRLGEELDRVKDTCQMRHS